MSWHKLPSINRRAFITKVSIRTYKSKPGRQAQLLLRIKKELLVAAGFDGSLRCDFLVGSGEHRGKLRLEPNSDGVAVGTGDTYARDNGVVLFRLGHVPQFPDVHMERGVSCEARVLGEGVEITVPENIEIAEPAVVPAARGAAEPVRPTASEGGPLLIDASSGKVKRNGHDTIIAGLPLALTIAVNRCAPEILDRTKAIKAIWPGSAPRSADVMLPTHQASANARLSKIGARIETVRSKGFRLVIEGVGS